MDKTTATALAVKALRDHAERCEAELRLRGRSAHTRAAFTRKAAEAREAIAVLSECPDCTVKLDAVTGFERCNGASGDGHRGKA